MDKFQVLNINRKDLFPREPCEYLDDYWQRLSWCVTTTPKVFVEFLKSSRLFKYLVKVMLVLGALRVIVVLVTVLEA